VKYMEKPSIARMISFERFAIPALRTMLGRPSFKATLVTLVSAFLAMFALSHFLLPSQPYQHISSFLPTGISGSSPSDPTLIIYSYFETANARTNAEFFIHHGLHDAADFLFIFNSPTNLDEMLPKVQNIEVVRRENKCFDLGGVAEVLNRNNGTLMTKYKKYIIMNASIRGPFIPTWSPTCWTDAYLDLITERNKLVGISYNCIPRPHVQSMLLATDNVGLGLIYPAINHCFDDKKDAIQHGELMLGSVIWDAGYTTAVMATAMNAPTYDITNCTHKDFWWEKKYYGMNYHPYETMFFKANRNVAALELDKLTEWHDGMGYSSYDACKKRR